MRAILFSLAVFVVGGCASSTKLDLAFTSSSLDAGAPPPPKQEAPLLGRPDPLLRNLTPAR